jgi:LysR family transcriptional regulator, transcription activator of glutamate synthase operon
MELRQLRYFAAVARHSSFTRAADELHVAQPALSQQVKRLERELGAELLARTTRRVELTGAGQVALTRATRILSEVDALTSELDEISGLLRGRLVVGGMLPAGGIDLPALLLRFKELHPGVDVQLQEGTAAEMVERLRGDEIDVAIAMLEPDEVPDFLGCRRLGEERLVLAMAPGDPLARRRRIGIAELEGRPFVSFRPGAAVRRVVDEALAEAGVAPQPAFETNDLSMMRAVVGRGLGVAVLPETVAAWGGPGLVWRPLAPVMRRSVAFLWRRARRQPPPAAAFIAFVEEKANVEPLRPRRRVGAAGG